MPNLESAGERLNDQIPSEVVRLVEGVDNDATVREQLQHNKLMEGTDWKAWDRSVEERLTKTNQLLNGSHIRTEELTKSLKNPNRFWITTVNGHPELAINHFFRFSTEKELLSLRRTMKNPGNQDEYLRLLNTKIETMEPEATPGELERWAQQIGYDVERGKLIPKSEPK